MELELKTLIEQGNATIAALRTEVEGLKSADIVSETKLAKMESDLAKTLSEKSALENRLAALETAQARPGAFGAKGEAVDEYKSAFLNMIRKPFDTEAKQNFETLSRKAVTVGTPANGGYAVPEQIAAAVNRVAVDLSPIRQIAKIVSVSTADYKEVLDNRNAGFEWVGESTARAITDTPTISEIVPAWGEMSAVAEISLSALEDIMFNADAWLIESLSEKFAQGEGLSFISGNGTNKPRGFLDGTTVTGINSGNASTLGTNPFDSIISLMFAVKGAYRQAGSFVMNSATAASLMKVKDTTGQYIYQPAIAEGARDTILGKRVVLAEDMPSVAANAKPIVFGDFRRGYLIADRTQFSVLPDPYSHTGFLQIKARKRVGGTVADANALKALVIAV
ncbi:phage major capsid protein [Paracoccus sp. SSK6]|uniref:phage major capsid protein n=1 Tax=Paracoccus sp. SSK6 TaxID=3143131 RepID=UPI00321BC0E2